MKLQHIELENYNIVVSDEQIGRNDLVIIDNKLIAKVLSISDTLMEVDCNWSTTQTKVITDAQKIIASTNIEHNLPSINYNGFEEEFNIIDIEKLSEDFVSSNGHFKKNVNNEIGWIATKNGFTEGFKKCQELNNKKFSLEDMKKAFSYYANCAVSPWDKTALNKDFIKFIQSLQQPKVINIEVEMKDIGGEEWIGDDYNGQPFWNEILIPKITNNQIKITEILV